MYVTLCRACVKTEFSIIIYGLSDILLWLYDHMLTF